MSAFDKLSKKEQKEVLKIAATKTKINTAIKSHNKTAQKAMKATLKKFLSNGDKYTEEQVPTKKLKYKKKYIARVQDTSGQFIERAMITFDNNYQLAITRPPQEYESDPNLFDVSPRKPDGELDTTLIDKSRMNQDIISGQTVADINKHISKVGALDPDEEARKAAKKAAKETDTA